MNTERHQLPAYPLRMPHELRAELMRAADLSGRSLNAEILFRLQARSTQNDAERILFDLAQIKAGVTRLLAKD